MRTRTRAHLLARSHTRTLSRTLCGHLYRLLCTDLWAPVPPAVYLLCGHLYRLMCTDLWAPVLPDVYCAGFVGTKELMLVLSSKCGRTDVAYRLLRTADYPGWGFSIANGATSIWERWDGYTPDKVLYCAVE